MLIAGENVPFFQVC